VALTHLADTSVLTRLRVADVRSAVRGLLAARSVAVCRMSRLELGYSARTAGEWDRILDALAVLPVVDVEPTDLRRAEQVQRQLADAALRGRKVPDLLIAAVAERLDLTVLHYDRDFEYIARMTGRPHQWVVPAGSVD
jgi:hypothetical protein